jgi:predicted nucleic acid-binding protein
VAERLLIEYLRGQPGAIEYLEEITSDLYISVVSIAELFAGVKGDREERSLEQFLLAFTILSVTERIARLGGIYRRDYGPSHGTGLADALIAATAEESGVTLVTFNRRHFPMVSNATVLYER